MGQLNSAKLSVTFIEGIDQDHLTIPRIYTLTHSDLSGDMFLTIGPEVNQRQIAGIYTRFMRDEVWAEWIHVDDFSLLVHCHVSGGIILGGASWRYAILNEHMPLVLEAFRYGDRKLFTGQPALDDAVINVRYHSSKKKFDQLVLWGKFREFQV